MLNLTQLKVLEAVARHGSVTVAAKELHYSQPSISHHLGRLEAATGAKLIQRVGRGIRLTPEGQLLAGRATEILGRVNAASVELAARVGLRAGRVRLAGFQTVLSTLVPRAAAELSSSYPRIELNLVDAHTGRGPADAAFGTRRHRLDLPARRHSPGGGGGGGTATDPPAGRPPLPHQRPTPSASPGPL